MQLIENGISVGYKLVHRENPVHPKIVAMASADIAIAMAPTLFAEPNTFGHAGQHYYKALVDRTDVENVE